MKNKKEILNLVVFSMLCALSYVGVFIRVPLPTGAFVHLGNFVCIMAALLLGGVKGGLVGTIGMTFWDLQHGYGPDIFVRTAILKFLMGFTTGGLFTLIRKFNTKKQTNLSVLFGLSAIFFICFVLVLVGYLNGGLMNKKGDLVPVHVLIPISICLFSVLFLVAGIFAIKKDNLYQRLLIVTSIGTLVNICGEVICRTVINMIHGFSFVPSIIDSVAKSPASLFTGILTIICACTLYPLLELALANKINMLKGEE